MTRLSRRRFIESSLVLGGGLPLAWRQGAGSGSMSDEDPRGPIANAGMTVSVDRDGVQAKGFVFANRPRRPKPWSASWIWLNEKAYAGMNRTQSDRTPVVALFHKEIALDEVPQQVLAWISADVRYRLFINGRLAARGPSDIGNDYADAAWSRQWLYDTRDLTAYFHKGRNVIAAEIFTQRFTSVFTTGYPGFIFEAEVSWKDRKPVTLKSDESWRGIPGEHARMVTQIPPGATRPVTFLQWDANKEIKGWREDGFDDSSWPGCSPAGAHWEPLAASELPPSMETRYPQIGIVRATGNVVVPERPFEKGRGVIVNSDGGFAVRYDRVLSAYVGLKIKGVAGAVVTIQPNEPNTDGFHRMAGWVLRDGVQYLELPFYDSFSVINFKFSQVSAPIEILDVSAVFTSYPVIYRGTFESNDQYLNRLWKVSRWATQICMQTHHLDSPHHQEPICDPGDYLIESLINYQAFGERWLARQDLRKFAAVLRDANYRNFHTSYSLLWLQWLIDYYDYTGDRELVIELASDVHRLLSLFETYRGKTGILTEARDYMFLDWVTIEGFNLHHPPAVIGQGYLTAFYFQALKNAGRVAKMMGDSALVRKYEQLQMTTAEAFERELWDAKRGLYRDGKPFQSSVRPHRWLPQDKAVETFSPHVNTLAVLYGLAPIARRQSIMRAIVNSPDFICQPYFMHFVFGALSKAGLFDEMATAQMRRWQVVEDTQSFREMWTTGDLSHAWGGTPLFQMSSRILGINPMTPGFGKIEIHPHLCDLSWAKGAVPTPRGEVRVAWARKPGELLLEISIPRGSTGEITFPKVGFNRPVFIVNGRRVGSNVTVGAGKHRCLVSDGISRRRDRT